MFDNFDKQNNKTLKDYFELLFEENINVPVNQIIEEIKKVKTEIKLSPEKTTILNTIEGLLNTLVKKPDNALKLLKDSLDLIKDSPVSSIKNRIEGEYGIFLINQRLVEEGIEYVKRAFEYLSGQNLFKPALNLIDRAVRVLREKERVDLAIEMCVYALSKTIPASFLKEELSLRALMGETKLLVGNFGEGQAEIESAMNRARLHGFYEVEYQALVGQAIAKALNNLVDDAIKLALRARKLASDNNDPVRYTSAVFLLMDFYESKDDRLSAYEVVLRGVKSMQEFFGDSVKGKFMGWLEGLRERWGDEEYEKVAREFIKRSKKEVGLSS